MEAGIDTSDFSSEVFQRAKKLLSNDARFKVWVSTRTMKGNVDFDIEDKSITLHIFVGEYGCSIQVMVNSDIIAHYSDEDRLLPMNLRAIKTYRYTKGSGIDPKKMKLDIATYKKSLPELEKAYARILKSFEAQSKEDFYDDASDYQDDEPTDFGDASNYDEGLVRRINEIKTRPQVDTFTAAAVEALLWAEIDDTNKDENSDKSFSDNGATIAYIATDSLIELAKDCAFFQEALAAELEIYRNETGHGDTHAGHDFSLSRNGHGAGFFDADMDDREARDRLSKAANGFGQIYLETDRKNKIHFRFGRSFEERIKHLRAQSKEDFYDDASDYQDDEPTDFGDASNYDENLVRRIKAELE